MRFPRRKLRAPCTQLMTWLGANLRSSVIQASARFQSPLASTRAAASDEKNQIGLDALSARPREQPRIKIAQQAKRGNSSKIACRLLRKPHTHFICARDRSEQVLTLPSKPDVMRERSRQIWTLLNNLEHQRVSFVIATVIVQARRCGKELLLKQGGRVENLLSHQTPSKRPTALRHPKAPARTWNPEMSLKPANNYNHQAPKATAAIERVTHSNLIVCIG